MPYLVYDSDSFISTTPFFSSSSTDSLVTLNELAGAALSEGSPQSFIALLIASNAERALTFFSSPFLSLLTGLATVTVQSATASSRASNTSLISRSTDSSIPFMNSATSFSFIPIFLAICAAVIPFLTMA